MKIFKIFIFSVACLFLSFLLAGADMVFGIFKTSAFSPAVPFLPEEQSATSTIASVENSTSSPASNKPEMTLIDIPLYWQKYRLSCEAASLKMALSAKGITVSEDEIMAKIGYDPTPHENGVWGDPNVAFVGDINGKIGITGYGVYWDPVAKAANNWRESEAFTNWNLEGLIAELEAGNPVVIWGALPVETITDISWFTPEGKYVKAIKQAHVRVAVGFIGSPVNPSKIIINDPLFGKLYWDTDFFMKNWQTFDYSGVAVR